MTGRGISNLFWKLLLNELETIFQLSGSFGWVSEGSVDVSRLVGNAAAWQGEVSCQFGKGEGAVGEQAVGTCQVSG